ncbi:MAG: BspA family leucine-rich repeat surface protein [Bacilli bacterium]|nr:BspA family leucine-rich repeat surface protein [Bacilli bacterium]
MKKLIYLFLLVIFMIPTFAYAEESCGNKGIFIKMIELKKTSRLTEELSDVSFEDNKINLDIKMYEVGDFVEYTFVVKNELDKDYVIDDKNINLEGSNIEYTLKPKDGSNKIKKGTEEEFTLIVTYKMEVEQEQFRAGKYDASSTVLLKVEEPKLIPIDINPKTGSIFCFCIFLMIGVSIFFLFKIKNTKIKALVLSMFFLLPVSVLADCNYDIELNSNIMIWYVKPNPCTYDRELVQGAEYTNGQYTYRYKQEYGYNSSTRLYEWQNIENDGWGVHLSDPSSTDPVTTKLCTSINNKPIVSMSNMFHNSQTTSIDTSSFDTSNVINMSQMFTSSINLESIYVLNFDTSNVTNMYEMFAGCTTLDSLNLSGFDLSSISYESSRMSSIFEAPNLQRIVLKDLVIPEFFRNSLFSTLAANCSSVLEEIDVTGWDLSRTIDISSLFSGCQVVKSIKGLDTWDTSHISNMENLFLGMTTVSSLDLSNWDLLNIYTVDGMFREASFDTIIAKYWKIPQTFEKGFFTNMAVSSVEEIDVTGWDLSGTTTLSNLFNTPYGTQNTSLKWVVGLSTWNISNITTMTNLFGYCNGIESLDFSNWQFENISTINLSSDILGLKKMNSLKSLDFSNVKFNNSMQFSFYELGGLEKIGLKGVDTSNVIKMNSCFSLCYSLKSIDLSDFDTSNVTNMEYMFNNCYSLLDYNFGEIDTSNVTDMSFMFSYAKSITSIDISYLNLSSIINLSNFCCYCDSLEYVNLSNIVAGPNFSINFCFGKCPELKTIIMDNWVVSNENSLYNAFSMYNDVLVETVSLKNLVAPVSLYNFFTTARLYRVKHLDVSNWDLSQTTSLYGLFKEAYSLKTITGLDTWDTSQVTDMSGMFKYCYVLDEVDLSNFDYSKVTRMDYMFEQDHALKTVNMGNFNAEVLENADSMFGQADGIEKIIFDSISTPNLKNATRMFYQLPKLKRLDLRGMDTSHVTSMFDMFSGNSALEYLDLSTFETNDSQNMSWMFYGCSSLTTAYAKTQADADRFNASSNKPDNVVFVVIS